MGILWSTQAESKPYSPSPSSSILTPIVSSSGIIYPTTNKWTTIAPCKYEMHPHHFLSTCVQIYLALCVVNKATITSWTWIVPKSSCLLSILDPSLEISKEILLDYSKITLGKASVWFLLLLRQSRKSTRIPRRIFTSSHCSRNFSYKSRCYWHILTTDYVEQGAELLGLTRIRRWRYKFCISPSTVLKRLRKLWEPYLRRLTYSFLLDFQLKYWRCNSTSFKPF